MSSVESQTGFWAHLPYWSQSHSHRQPASAATAKTVVSQSTPNEYSLRIVNLKLTSKTSLIRKWKISNVLLYVNLDVQSERPNNPNLDFFLALGRDS
jgi:hypothetical protein